MKKKLLFSLLLGLSSPLFAGLVDDGDKTGFPNVNVDAHLLKIARNAFPDAVSLSQGMNRADAWRHDVTEAAAGLDIPADKLEKFLGYVLQPNAGPIVPAPHPKLKEFELYARGLQTFKRGDVSPLPKEWQELMKLPVAERRYTTIPVLYQRMAIEDDDWLRAITDARRAGCVDTQGCELSLVEGFRNASYYWMNYWAKKDFSIRHNFYHALIYNFAIHGEARKTWRYTNVMDKLWEVDSHGDKFFVGHGKMPTLFYFIYCDGTDYLNWQLLNDLCEKSPVIRDVFVAVGLTNCQIAQLRKLAVKYAMKSPLNAPVLALRLPPEEADKLLAQYPEHAALRALLQIKQLSGQAKVDAIDRYLKTFPDYTPEDMESTSVALNTHGELTALAGLELLNMGKVAEAMERWSQSSTPEDVGLIAEQIFSTDELLDFCRKIAARPAQKQWVFSFQQKVKGQVINQPMLKQETVTYLLRDILARRLMRDRRYEEAQKWFPDYNMRFYAQLFIHLKGIAEDAQKTPDERYLAEFRMGDLLRKHGDELFGTWLEPDNMICEGKFNLKWGVNFTAVKLHKPDLPRFHYRWAAAEHYRAAAKIAPDAKRRGYALWCAGTLLKNIDKVLADKDFKALAAVAPDLIEKNWFKPVSQVSPELQTMYQEPVSWWECELLPQMKLELPEVEKVELPPELKTPEELYRFGRQISESNENQKEKLKQACYALYLAGQQGLSDAYAWCGKVERKLFIMEYGHRSHLAFMRQSLAVTPSSKWGKYMFALNSDARTHYRYLLGVCREIADDETVERALRGEAAYEYHFLYDHLEEVQAFVDKASGEKYFKIAVECGCPAAIEEQNLSKTQTQED